MSEMECCNRHRMFGEVWFMRYACGQTDRQTDTLMAIRRSPTEGGVYEFLIYTSLFTIMVDKKTQNRHKYKKRRKKTNELTKRNYYTGKHIIHMSTLVAACSFLLRLLGLSSNNVCIKTKGRLHHPYLNRHLANGHLILSSN